VTREKKPGRKRCPEVSTSVREVLKGEAISTSKKRCECGRDLGSGERNDLDQRPENGSSGRNAPEGGRGERGCPPSLPTTGGGGAMPREHGGGIGASDL